MKKTLKAFHDMFQGSMTDSLLCIQCLSLYVLRKNNSVNIVLIRDITQNHLNHLSTDINSCAA